MNHINSKNKNQKSEQLASLNKSIYIIKETNHESKITCREILFPVWSSAWSRFPAGGGGHSHAYAPQTGQLGKKTIYISEEIDQSTSW